MLHSYTLKFFLLALLATRFGDLCSQSKWNDEMYLDYNHESFSNFTPANSQISFQEVDYPLLNAALFYKTNEIRVLENLPIGKHSNALEKAASGHSYDMVNKNFFSHTGKKRNKKTVRDRIKNAGIENGTVSENIAISFGIDYKSGEPVYKPSQNGGYFSYKYKGKPIETLSYIELAERVLAQWMNSPGHRRNILLGLEYIGCGSALIPLKSKDDFPKFKITQNFSSRDSQTTYSQ